MASWFGFTKSASSKQASGPTTIKALPASWYSSPRMYELERRAVFSKKWILVSHKNRFPETGDYVRITEAGITFFLIKDRQGNIRAHHNVCRHRAYPLIEKDSGTASILACKYHGKSRVPCASQSLLRSGLTIWRTCRLVLWIRWQISQSSKVPRAGRF